MRPSRRIDLALCLVVGSWLLILPQAAQGQPEEHVVSDEWVVGKSAYILESGIPPCGENEIDPLEEAVKLYAGWSTAGVWGALFETTNMLWKQAGSQMGGDGAGVLDRIVGNTRYANCVAVGVVIPASATWAEAHVQAAEVNGPWVDCAAGVLDCPIGWSRFDALVDKVAGRERVIGAVFRNWSGGKDGRTRRARIFVRFTLPQ